VSTDGIGMRARRTGPKLKLIENKLFYSGRLATSHVNASTL